MKKEKDRVLIIELRDAVWESACNRTLKKDYPLLLSLCRDAGISTYTLNLFIVTAQTKLKNPTETYVKYHPKELEREPVEIEKIKFVEKIPLRYRVYKILFFSLLFVIVALWICKGCGRADNWEDGAMDSSVQVQEKGELSNHESHEAGLETDSIADSTSIWIHESCSASVLQHFNYERLGYSKRNEHAEIELTVDFPNGESLLVDSICKHINNLLGDKYYSSHRDGKCMIEHFGRFMFKEYEQMHKESNDSELFEDSPFSLNKEITVICLKEMYVTYLYTFYLWTGGIHGIGGKVGLTFDKSSGRQVDYSFFRNLERESFKQLLKAGLKRYFVENGWKASTDEEFTECLMGVDDINNIPLPGADPYFTSQGINFVYGSYEIAPYSAGYPSFILSYEDAKPYLSEEALGLIE